MNPESAGFIIVDGLDEAAGAAEQITIPRLLSQALPEFPSWLKLVITTRRDDRVPRFLSADRYILSGTGAEQKDDLRQYVERRFLEPTLHNQCADEAHRRRVISALVERSLGNFQYATTVLDELARGRLKSDQIGSLPASLADLMMIALMHGFRKARISKSRAPSLPFCWPRANRSTECSSRSSPASTGPQCCDRHSTSSACS